MFVPIDGYDNYEINEEGQVRNTTTQRILKQHINIGYYRIGLYKNGVQDFYKIHRLVANAFIKNPNNHPFVDHADQNKKNNAISNLRWCTRTENNHNVIYRELQGVCANRKRYQAKISYNNKQICLGTYDTPEEAHWAYIAKKNELAGEFSPYK